MQVELELDRSAQRNTKTLVNRLARCVIIRDASPHAELHPWEFPLVPWQRLHADFAEYAAKRYLILVDAHSKWIEALPMSRTDTQSTITALMCIFSRFGLPSQLVTDNGPPFFSQDFKDYCVNNAIKHTTTAPYRPQGNGAAENAVKIVKKAIKRAVLSGENVLQAISTFLLYYRNCEHATTGVPPSVLLMGRRARIRLDALRPDVAAVAQEAQRRQVAAAGGTPRSPARPGDLVLARDYSARSDKWSVGTVSQRTGPVSYRVDMGNGIQWRRHQDQILPVSGKNRFSLSRASMGGKTVENKKNEEFTEAAAATGDVDEQISHPSEVHPPSPPPDNASERTLRAYKRALNKV
ncbi:hypothetical protein ACJJTC_004627 [Scirpophaga incertulas]